MDCSKFVDFKLFKGEQHYQTLLFKKLQLLNPYLPPHRLSHLVLFDSNGRKFYKTRQHMKMIITLLLSPILYA